MLTRFPEGKPEPGVAGPVQRSLAPRVRGWRPIDDRVQLDESTTEGDG